MLSLGRWGKRREHLPPEIYVSLVDWLYQNTFVFLSGALATAIAVLLTAAKSENTALWLIGAAIFAVACIRALDMRAYKKSKVPHTPEVMRVWELRYAIGAGVFHFLLGLWGLVGVAYTDDSATHMISSAITVAYASAGAGRNCGRPYIVVLQFVASIGPLVIGLLLTEDVFYIGMAMLSVFFFVSLMRVTFSLYDALFKALSSTRDMTLLASRFDTALNNMPHGLCMFDAEGKLVVANSRLSNLLGIGDFSKEKDTTVWELLYRCVQVHLITEFSAERVALLFEKHLADRNTGHILTDTINGQTFSFTFQPMENGGSVVLVEDVTERKNAEAKISHMARYDALTGLPNRTFFRDQIEKALAVTRHNGRDCAVLFIDLDQFKQVNDTLGHPCGDQLLCNVSDRLRKIIGDNDIVARFGGDEFVVFQAPIRNAKEASLLAKNIVKRLEEPYDIEGHHVVIGASVGIAVTTNETISADSLMKNADMALYRAKSDGRGTWRFFEPEMAVKAEARRNLELDLRRAIENESFKVFYQPLVNLQTMRISTCEALLRWPHPERGMVSPSEFIPIAEEMGLIFEMSKWVLRRACAEATQWPSEVKVAVNLSPIQFRRGDVVGDVRHALETTGLDPNRLEVEITETVLLQDTRATHDALNQLRELGVRISLDDFGTGYSSLSYLHSFPLQKVKIDRSFLEGLGTSDRPITLLHGVARLSVELGMSVVVEGVETEEQLALISAEEGITEAQGYLFSPPIPSRQIRKLLQASATIRKVA